jgi:two-component system sensor histidine kinase KdpD
VMALSFGGQQVGSLGVKGLLLSDTALRALSSLLSLGIVNAGAQQAAARADAARQSEEFRSTLMDAVAHEFKTPLTSIKGAVSAVLSETVRSPEEQREMLEIIDEASDRLRGLVTEAIHLARIEANAIRLRREPHEIGTAVGAALAQPQPLLEGRRVEVSIDPDTPPVLVDAELIQLVLRHLLDNAVKYSPPDSPIHVSARREDKAVVVRIRNQGEGVPEWQRGKVFEKFYRGANTRDRVPGTGMGLAITREIVLAHGGTIRLESAPGEGVEVVLALPVSKGAERV